MHIGAHWGSWAMSVMALSVGLFLILRSRRNKKWNWAAAGVLALILAVGMFYNGWSVWPTQTASHFISVVYDGSNEEVLEMLSEPSQWTITDDGGVAVLAEDSTKVTLSPDDLPLMAGGSKVPITVRVLGEVLAAKRDFTIATSKNRKCTIHCTVERGKVRIRHVEVSDPDPRPIVVRKGDSTIPAGKYRLSIEQASETATQIVVKVELPPSTSSQQRAFCRISSGLDNDDGKGGGTASKIDLTHESVALILVQLIEDDDSEGQYLKVGPHLGAEPPSDGGRLGMLKRLPNGVSLNEVFSLSIQPGLFDSGTPILFGKCIADDVEPHLRDYNLLVTDK